jgi:hypothetical protein
MTSHTKTYALRNWMFVNRRFDKAIKREAIIEKYHGKRWDDSRK